MSLQRIPLGLYQAPNPLPKCQTEGVFLIDMENIDIDQVVAMLVYFKNPQHPLMAGNPPASSGAPHEH